MSTVKNLMKVAVGTTAILGVFSTVVYEFLLNIRFAAKIGEKFPPMEKELSEEEKEQIQESLPDTSGFNKAVESWLSTHTAADVYITNENGLKRHAKVFDNGHPEKWAIIFHGYTSGPGGMYHYAYAYAQMGFNCILPSMIGHAEDEHRYCSMGYHDRYMGIDWINYILTLNPDAKIALHGESMGAATTMLITGEKLPKNVKCAVADCGFTSVFEEYSHVTKHQMSPVALPLLPVISRYSEMRGNFNFKKCAPVEAVKYSETPTLFVHGESDDFVPFSMLDEVYSACAAEKEFFTVKGAAHAESSTKNPKLYWTNVYNFVKEYIAL
ncbi:MAG: alpha/beta hydrolase [Clostridia bacterium]|nr:alpha/beta hydrolase [Clostridia bacterium]